MTLLSGSDYFPGGMSGFIANTNEFLEFEQGPSMDVILQWATYRDASDQCSLSRIWGGIHPPMDDIPGRHIGMELGPEAFHFAKEYFGLDVVTDVQEHKPQHLHVYPNPASEEALVTLPRLRGEVIMELIDVQGRVVYSNATTVRGTGQVVSMDVSGLPTGIYLLRVNGAGQGVTSRLAVLR